MDDDIATFDAILHCIEVALALGVLWLTLLIARSARRSLASKERRGPPLAKPAGPADEAEPYAH